MKLRLLLSVLSILVSLSAEGEVKTVFLQENSEFNETELVIDVKDGQVIELFVQMPAWQRDSVIWTIDFGSGSVFEKGGELNIPILAGPLKLKVEAGPSGLLMTYRTSSVSQQSKASPKLQKLSLEGPNMTTEYSVSPGFIYSLSSSSDMVVWEKVGEYDSAGEDKLTISQSVPKDDPKGKVFYKLQ